MSLAFARALAQFCQSHDVPVTWEPGADKRGNGQTSAYQGLSVHHTGGQSLNVRTNDLVNGRVSPPLAGPLCNSAGLANGGLHIVAVNPANHAGASGGWDTAPLPVTGLFNKLMWGHEVMYPGTRPMSSEQYRTATVLGAGVCRLTGHDYDPRWVKFHQGTSITGKWDPGLSTDRKTYAIAAFRGDVLTVMKGQHEMAAAELSATGLQQIKDLLRTEVIDRTIVGGGPNDPAVPLFLVLRETRQLLKDLNGKLRGEHNLGGRPGRDADDLVGHVLSLRAELRRLEGQLEAVDTNALAEAIVSRLDGRAGLTKDDVREVLGELRLTVGS